MTSGDIISKVGEDSGITKAWIIGLAVAVFISSAAAFVAVGQLMERVSNNRDTFRDQTEDNMRGIEANAEAIKVIGREMRTLAIAIGDRQSADRAVLSGIEATLGDIDRRLLRIEDRFERGSWWRDGRESQPPPGAR